LQSSERFRAFAVSPFKISENEGEMFDFRRNQLKPRFKAKRAFMVLVLLSPVALIPLQVAQAASSKTIVLNFWNGMTGPDKPALDQVIKDFNKSQSGIKVVNVPLPWDVFYQKLSTSVASGKGPDFVAMSGSNLANYAKEGTIKDIGSFYASSKYMDTSKLAKVAINAGVVGGKHYGVPLNLATLMLFWNKDLFKAAGLNPEKPPTNWTEFSAMVPKLTILKDGNPVQYAFSIADHATIPVYQLFVWNNGGDLISKDGKKALFSDPATVSAMEYWVDLIANKKASPIGMGGADSDNLFISKKAAMEIAGPWMTSGFTAAGIDYGVTRPFAGPKNQITLADSVQLAVSSKADDRKTVAALKFFAFWNSKKEQIVWATGSGFPSARTDLTAKDLAANPYPALFGAKAVLDNSRLYYIGIPAAGAVTDDVFYPTLQKALNGKGTVKDLFTAANQEAQDKLDGK